ncbi:Uncharacterized protein CTYZ_00002743 [Cryptosporidium tyzzeri]|nr:Uncharacterized protein CTYZ_00002743 [Cryptosporidium tyzzeri]
MIVINMNIYISSKEQLGLKKYLVISSYSLQPNKLDESNDGNSTQIIWLRSNYLRIFSF